VASFPLCLGRHNGEVTPSRIRQTLRVAPAELGAYLNGVSEVGWQVL